MNPTDIVPIPKNINTGLSSAKNSTMIQILGRARDTFDDKCRPATNDPIKSLLTTKDVGPFRVTGIKPAVKSLEEILRKVKKDQPDVFAVLGTAGMYCGRLISGSSKISNHGWGTAVDISLGSILDGLSKPERSDGKTLAGLAAIAPIFNDAGWYWGVGFSTFEDGMHFEVADETIRDWQASGEFGKKTENRVVTEPNLSFGDMGVEVALLQAALAKHGFDILPDGEFGPITHAIVMDFQAANGLLPDGIVGPETKNKLGLK
jgi:Putative peptidoglycan binding domain/D-alanyl-D-alanine carboxypeptidase